MPNSVIQCGNCGHETPAESIYCEKCGTYLKDVAPEQPALTWDSDAQDMTMPEEASELLTADLLQAAPPSEQPTTPPSFAEVVGLDGDFLEPESASQDAGPYYSLEGYIGPATLETQLPSIPSFELNDGEYPTVDPQSPPYQPKLGAFRSIVVGLMAVLFGIAIVLLFCLVVMHLLGF